MAGALKLYIDSLMKDKNDGFFDTVIKKILGAVSRVYLLALKVNDLTYARGIQKRYKAGIPVISVGNITLGGTGKTPFTMMLAGHFIAAGKKPAVITRGYGRDEDKLILEELADVPVIVGRDRVISSAKAVEAGRNIIIMDDGFQHRRLERDLDILLLDAREPFGIGELFPRGTLRERVSACKRADLIVVTRIDALPDEKIEERVLGIRSLFPEKPVFTARHKPVYLKDAAGNVHALGHLKDKKVMAVAGIADPSVFIEDVSGLGCDVRTKVLFEDHHAYSASDMRLIAKKLAEGGLDAVVTTAKDHVKMREISANAVDGKLYILHVEMEIVQDREAFFGRLDRVAAGQGN